MTVYYAMTTIEFGRHGWEIVATGSNRHDVEVDAMRRLVDRWNGDPDEDAIARRDNLATMSRAYARQAAFISPEADRQAMEAMAR